jgi:hypothetical protein
MQNRMQKEFGPEFNQGLTLALFPVTSNLKTPNDVWLVN